MSSTTAPSYRDGQLRHAVKELRAAVKGVPAATLALAKVETRLKYNLRVVEQWDAHHAACFETLIALGKVEAANSTASLIFDDTLRAALYDRSDIGLDSETARRVAESQALGREVLA